MAHKLWRAVYTYFIYLFCFVFFFKAKCTQEKEDLKNRLTASHKYMFDLLAAALFLDPAVVEGFLLTIPSVSFTQKLIMYDKKNLRLQWMHFFLFLQDDLST